MLPANDCYRIAAINELFGSKLEDFLLSRNLGKKLLDCFLAAKCPEIRD
jgi:hypothetical protein